MKLKELLKQDIDVDVGSSLTDDWGFNFIGPLGLTKEGEEMFASILDNEVTVCRYDAEIEVLDMKQDRLAWKFFKYVAGYCYSDTFDRLFVE